MHTQIFNTLRLEFLKDLLGPLLFLLFIKNMPLIAEHLSLEMYAVDSTMHVIESSVSVIESKLNDDLKR